jgi:hypothetical protein
MSSIKSKSAQRCHLGPISKFQKETLLLRPFKFRASFAATPLGWVPYVWRTIGEHDQHRLNSTKLCYRKSGIIRNDYNILLSKSTLQTCSPRICTALKGTQNHLLQSGRKSNLHSVEKKTDVSKK